MHLRSFLAITDGAGANCILEERASAMVCTCHEPGEVMPKEVRTKDARRVNTKASHM
jgi:hypothetical protein